MKRNDIGTEHLLLGLVRGFPPAALLVAGWLLFALALGAGVLIGWAIWA